MSNSDSFDNQRQELRIFLEQHRKLCADCNDSYYCDIAIAIVNNYMADQEQQGN